MPVKLSIPEPEELLPVAGVKLGTACASIKKPGRRDLLVVELAKGSRVSGVFTKNRFCAAPVLLCREHLEAGKGIRALVVNTGNANAGTGEEGLRRARQTCRELASLLGCEESQILPFSTGVILEPLPVDKIVAGLPSCISNLSETNWFDAAEAIMTTDIQPKALSRQIAIDGRKVTITGIAKGSGMIHPNLATMLAVVTTDYPLEAGEAIEFLRPAVEASFNAISVDGECSTNDTVLLLANGASGCKRDDDAFAAALRTVCGELAKQIVADGEGATVLAEIAVRGAASAGEARAIAERVATSPLVKTALHGHDANWGRIAAAAGSAKVNGGYAELDLDRLSIVIDGVPVLVGGVPSGDEPALANGHCAIELDLALGDGAASYLTTDLSYDYVRINAEYRS